LKNSRAQKKTFNRIFNKGHSKNDLILMIQDFEILIITMELKAIVNPPKGASAKSVNADPFPEVSPYQQLLVF